jgi:hypothetical protein
MYKQKLIGETKKALKAIVIFSDHILDKTERRGCPEDDGKDRTTGIRGLGQNNCGWTVFGQDS